jgi:hypothetical protein
MDQRTTLDDIRGNRSELLAALDKRLGIVRDLVRGVGKRHSTGLYLFGHPGTSKTHTVTDVLRREFNDGFVRQSGHLTPLGLFELIGEHRDSVIVLDDLGELLKNRVAMQLLLAALEKPVRRDGGRPVTYRRHDEVRTVNLYGGIVCISNLVLHDTGLLGALRSRVVVLNYDPPDAQIGALMLDIAGRGWPFGSSRPAITSAEATEVAEYVIAETLRLGRRFDLRLLVAKALPVFLHWKKRETESHWRDLVSASAEEQLVAVREETGPLTRAGRIAEERAVALAILQQYPARAGQLRAWVERTGRSGRAYYRRLDGDLA